MTPKNAESEPSWNVVLQSQIEQAARAERIEENQIRSDQKIDRLVGVISGLASSLGEYTAELRHTSKDVADISDDVKALTGRVTVIEIKGQERDTKIRMMVGACAAALSGAIAWFVSKVGG